MAAEALRADLEAPAAPAPEGRVIEEPVTPVKVFGWYDDEYGSHVNLLEDLSVEVARRLD